MEVSAEALSRFSRAISIPTVSAQNYAHTNFAAFDEFKAFLRGAFPLFHKTLSLLEVNRYGLVYKLAGTDGSLAPLLFCAHYDVVPVEEGTEKAWKYEPFSGAIAEGRVWGRGAFDIKCQITAQMEAVEGLLREGYRNARDVYFAYGHDEETGGLHGAAKIAAAFAQMGLRFEGVLDEGGAVTTDAIKGMTRPLAMIGVTEKGRADYEVTVTGEGGHSSTPPTHSALGLAARLISEVENHPMRPRLTPVVRDMLCAMKGGLGGAAGAVLGNPRLFKPLLLRVLAGSPVTAAFTRTTFAVTQASGSEAANVLPQKARFVIDSRLLHGDSVDSVHNYLNSLFRGAAEVKCVYGEEPSAVSPADSPFYKRLVQVIARVFPDALSVPYLVCGGTDARKYYAVSANVYRFTPAYLTTTEEKAMHGTNESLRVENYGRMIGFYAALIKEAGK